MLLQAVSLSAVVLALASSAAADYTPSHDATQYCSCTSSAAEYAIAPAYSTTYNVNRQSCQALCSLTPTCNSYIFAVADTGSPSSCTLVTATYESNGIVKGPKSSNIEFGFAGTCESYASMGFKRTDSNKKFCKTVTIAPIFPTGGYSRKLRRKQLTISGAPKDLCFADNSSRVEPSDAVGSCGVCPSGYSAVSALSGLEYSGNGKDCATVENAADVGCENGQCVIYTCSNGLWPSADGQSCVTSEEYTFTVRR